MRAQKPRYGRRAPRYSHNHPPCQKGSCYAPPATSTALTRQKVPVIRKHRRRRLRESDNTYRAQYLVEILQRANDTFLPDEHDEWPLLREVVRCLGKRGVRLCHGGPLDSLAAAAPACYMGVRESDAG